MAQLGAPLVHRYYRWQLEGPHLTYAHGAWDAGELTGFCFGGVHPEAITGFFARNKAFIAWQLLKRPTLILTPLFRDRILHALRFFRPRTKAPSLTTRRPEPKMAYDILSMAVHPRRQGSGIGRRLMAAAETAAREHGFEMMTLCVNVDNMRGIRFYESCGWSRTVVSEGVLCMEKRLAPSGPTGPSRPAADDVR